MFPAKVAYLEEKRSNQVWQRLQLTEERPLSGAGRTRAFQEPAGTKQKRRLLLCQSQNALFLEQRPGRVGQTSEHEIPLLEMVGVLVGAWRRVV